MKKSRGTEERYCRWSVNDSIKITGSARIYVWKSVVISLCCAVPHHATIGGRECTAFVAFRSNVVKERETIQSLLCVKIDLRCSSGGREQIIIFDLVDFPSRYTMDTIGLFQKK
jgi:hypothetical protein